MTIPKLGSGYMEFKNSLDENDVNICLGRLDPNSMRKRSRRQKNFRRNLKMKLNLSSDEPESMSDSEANEMHDDSGLKANLSNLADRRQLSSQPQNLNRKLVFDGYSSPDDEASRLLESHVSEMALSMGNQSPSVSADAVEHICTPRQDNRMDTRNYHIPTNVFVSARELLHSFLK
jgi:hypothetical protein